MARLHQGLSDLLVQVPPLALRQAPVRDLADGLVTEPPPRCPAGVVPHEDLRLLETLEILGLRVRHRGELLPVEGEDEDGGPPGEVAEPMTQAVQPGGHDRLHGGRERASRAGGAVLPGAEDHAGRLDDEERVPARAARDLRGFGIADAPAGRLPHQLHRLEREERIQPQRDGVDRPRPPCRPLLQQLRPARARSSSARLGTFLAARRRPLDQIEHRRTEHVHVFEHEHDLSARAEALDQRRGTRSARPARRPTPRASERRARS